jgi:predicted TIM-barrel enzyme
VIEDVVEDTIQRALADAVIITGPETEAPPDMVPLQTARMAAKGALVFAGSGAREVTIPSILEIVDGAIVGSAFKVDGVATNPVDAERVKRFMDAARAQR